VSPEDAEPEPPRAPGWIEEVRSRLSRWERKPLAAPPNARRAAVLVPLYVRDGGLWVVFTLRTDSLEHHRGQISFPGGAHEPEDATLYHTALREADEELGIRPEDAIPLGRLSAIVTVTDFYVEPFVVALPSPYEWRPQESEIAEVIEAPIADLMRPEALEKRKFEGREEPVLFYHHGKHVIWGATARILSELLEALETRSPI
jgi:8-oxo-dGTP pyrophosphatase MutT (NUDIX family)